MTDATPRRRINRPFLTLVSCLDATDEKPNLAMILNAASSAVRVAEAETQEGEDELTAIDAKGARGLLMQALQQAASLDHGNLETLVADALELAIKALRRGLEIEAGLCQPLTAPQLYGRAAVHKDLTRLGTVERCRVEEWIAAWHALPSWEPPVGRDHDRRTVMVNVRLDQLLDQIRVPAEVSRWLDARRTSQEA